MTIKGQVKGIKYRGPGACDFDALLALGRSRRLAWQVLQDGAKEAGGAPPVDRDLLQQLRVQREHFRADFVAGGQGQPLCGRLQLLPLLLQIALRGAWPYKYALFRGR